MITLIKKIFAIILVFTLAFSFSGLSVKVHNCLMTGKTFVVLSASNDNFPCGCKNPNRESSDNNFEKKSCCSDKQNNQNDKIYYDNQLKSISCCSEKSIFFNIEIINIKINIEKQKPYRIVDYYLPYLIYCDKIDNLNYSIKRNNIQLKTPIQKIISLIYLLSFNNKNNDIIPPKYF